MKRTMPFLEKFSEHDEKWQALKNVLQAYSLYDPKIGYIQGMNFVASSLVYHCDEFVAFSLLSNIIEHLEMRDIYLPSNK